MKYVIKWKTEVGTTQYLVQHNEYGSYGHTQSLTLAKLYESWDEASAAISVLNGGQSPFVGRIYGVSDKELFEARLKG